MTNKSATELRKEIREGYDKYMRNHYAKIQLNFLASLSAPESTIDRMVREAKSRLAVSIEANANYELIQMKKSWVSADDGHSDYISALRTLRQKQREYLELAEEVSMRKLNINHSFGKFGQRNEFIDPRVYKREVNYSL